MDDTRRTAIIVCRDDAHGFLLESLLGSSVQRVLRVATSRAALDLVLRGERPALVLLDVALFEDADEATATAERLRVIAPSAVVLEVGEHLAYSGESLADRLRGNSVEAHEWFELRTG